MPEAYTQKCASCHTAYPPGMLGQASWRRIMGTLEEWRALAEQHSPVALANGILVPRRGFRAPDSMPPPGPASAAAVEAPVKRARRRRRTALRSGVGHDPR